MFGISFPELLVVLCIIMLVLKPKDIKGVIKSYKTLQRQFLSFKKECSRTFDTLTDEHLTEKDKTPHLVMDEQGKTHIAYDIEEIKKNHRKNKDKTSTAS